MSKILQASYRLTVKGLSNENQVRQIDNELKKINLIQFSEIDFLSKSLHFIADNSENVAPEIIKSIRSSNCDVATQKNIFPVLNMSCASCAASSQSVLQQTFGVVSAEVNFANNSAKIEFVPGLTDVKKLKAALQFAGFDLVLDEDNENNATGNLQEKKYGELKTRVIWSLIFSIPVAIIGMFFMNIKYANFIMWALATPVVFWFGKDFFINAYKQLKSGRANMDTLVAISTGTAYIFSVFNTLFNDFLHSKDFMLMYILKHQQL